ncbi:MAG: signal peptidase II [Tissierellia bacterium]|nr:signal peptidase II [Tissierellia bacterium]
MIFLLVPLFIILDQVSKILISKYLKYGSKAIFGDWFHLTYVENPGAAFGMLAGRQTFFIVLTVAVVLFFSFFLYKEYGQLNGVEKWAAVCFLSGAIGNLIDRIIYGYVIDFIDITFFGTYHFPVFNVADILISMGAFFFLISVFYRSKA